MMYSFFWVIHQLLNFICRPFGTHCSEVTDCSETPVHIIHTPGNHPKERIQQELWFLCHIVSLCLHYQSRVIFTNRQSQLYRSCTPGRYSILLHVSAVHIRHHQVGYWFRKRVKVERSFPINSKCKVIIK